jgi:2-hydroxychromene-2-carboxylate isomerase
LINATRAFWRAYWSQGVDISLDENILKIMKTLDLSDAVVNKAIADANSESIKTALKETTNDAISRV